MAFNKQLPEWKAKGIKPPQNKLDEGWKAQDKPPAAWLNWQMNSTYESLQELQQNAVDNRDVSSVPSANGIVRLDGEGHLNEQALADAKSKTVQLNPGLQIVESEADTPLNLGNVQGRTLINLLGRMGKGDSTANWSGVGANVISSNDSLKVTALTAPEHTEHFAEHKSVGFLNIQGGAYYVVVGQVHVERGKDAYIRPIEFSGEIVTGEHSDAVPKIVGEGTKATSVFSFKTKASTNKLVVRLQVSKSSIANFNHVSVYEVSQNEYEAIQSMTPEQVRAQYPYVDGITNVKNPFAIATGDNLVPPFYEWNLNKKATVTAPYTMKLTVAGTEYDGSFATIPALENTTYTLQGDAEGGGYLYADVRGVDGSHQYHLVKNGSVTFTTGLKVKSIDVLATNDKTVNRVMTFSNVMLSIGTQPKMFKPQQRSMWAVETQLGAHPVTGADADVLFTGDDGLPYVNEKWGKVTLESAGEWKRAPQTPAEKGYRKVFLVLPELYGITRQDTQARIFIEKYNGNRLSYYGGGGTYTGPDQYLIDADKAILEVSISNNDSGWDDSYSPATEDIKAYFMGYQMGHWTGKELLTPYTGTGTKGWRPLTDSSSGNVQQLDVPIIPAAVKYPAFSNAIKPYRIQFLNASPIVKSISNYELGATLCTDANMVEVGSGIVFREKAYPSVNMARDSYTINSDSKLDFPSRLDNRVDIILGVFKNHKLDNAWNLHNTFSPFGRYRASIAKEHFDLTATYRVTYTMLDPTLKASIIGMAPINLRGTISDVVQSVGDVERRLSVVENQKADKDVVPPKWIVPSLLNGWKAYGDGYYQNPRYRKAENGIVYIEGLVRDGTISAGTTIFALPSGYRTNAALIFNVVGVEHATGVVISVRVDVTPNGDVRINQSGTALGNPYLSLSGISFVAEH